jgi:hypothetical protein
MVRRWTQRRRKPSRDQAVLECTQQAGDRVVSLAFWRCCCTRTGPLAWLTGFHAGYYGAPYVWPLGPLDQQFWALGFIEGRGHRGQP